MVDPHYELSGARAPTVPSDRDVQMSVKHDFSDTFEGEKFMGNVLVKVSCIVLLIVCANFSLTMSFNLLFFIVYFT